MPSHVIVPRSEWGARKPKARHTITTPTPELWLHHSAGSGADEKAVRAIQNYHMDTKGWNDIAYSFLIDDDPGDVDIFEGRGPGVAGGHTEGHNTISHGICIVGNFQTRPPSDETLDALVWLVAHGHRKGWWPDRITGGHRDVGSTACPGDALYRLIPDINREIQRTLGRPASPSEGGPFMSAPLKDYEKKAIARLEREGIFTKYTTDEPGEVDRPVPIRTFAVFIDRLLDAIPRITPGGKVTREQIVAAIVDKLQD